MSFTITNELGHKIVQNPDGKIVSRGGLVMWFERTPVGVALTLSCATHRTWALEHVVAKTDIELSHASPAIVLRVVADALEVQAFNSRESCACATPLRIT